jgi:hypothetical protein
MIDFKAIGLRYSAYFQPVLSVPKGQGVIEYAGALVIGATMIAAVLALFPNAFTELFFANIESILNFIISNMPT